jgi:hypothetical protein
MAKSLTLEKLAARLKDAEKFYRTRNENMDGWRELYFRDETKYFADLDGKLPEQQPDEVRIVLPVAQTTVDSFIELLLTKKPTITVPPSSVQTDIQEAVEHNEKALYATWESTNVHRRACDSCWHGLVDGWGVLQVVWDPSVDSSDGECPIVILSHDPMNVYPIPGSRPDTWEYVIHAYPKLVGSIRSQYESGMDRRRKADRHTVEILDSLKDTDEVTYIEYWDKDTFAVAFVSKTKSPGRGETVVGGWLHEPEDHKYGFLPWIIYFPCRLPFNTVGERFGVSLLYAVEELAQYISRLFSRRATFIERHLDPPIVTKTSMGADFEPIVTEAGAHYRLDQDDDAFYLVNPMMQAGSALEQQVAWAQSHVDEATLPQVLRGQYVGSLSGIAMSLLRNPTLMKVAFKQDALEEALQKLNVMVLKLYSKFLKKPWYLWGTDQKGEPLDVMVDRAKIRGYYRNRVKLSASLPTDDANTVNMITAMVQMKLISQQTGRDVLQQMLHDLLPQSVSDETKRILAEAILQNPMIIQAMAMKAAQEGGLPIPMEMGQQENPRGGYGEQAAAMPAQTIAPQEQAMAGGNTAPDIWQRLGEMQTSAQIAGRAEEKVE